jgi:glycosyltransferase involved in cell wall biosynthesis
MKKLKIACYGFVDKNAGSCARAHFLILEELVKRGIRIDFFGYRGFNRAEELESYPNFRYIDLPSASPVGNLMNKLPPGISKTLYPFVNILFNDSLHAKSTQRVMLSEHGFANYDILIFLGLYAPFRLVDVPTVSLLQGVVGAEWALIRKHRKTIIKFCGRTLYSKMKVYYALKDSIARTKLDCTDVTLCTSQWTKNQAVQSGSNPDNVHIIPYPLELDKFLPRTGLSNKSPNQEKILLSLGRLDPRKRLDLLLDAFTLVLQERDDVLLKVIGGFNYVSGYHRMIEEFPFPDKLLYQSGVEQSQVPELMQSCDLLVQSSEGENFGSSVAEALCCGLPVIVGSSNGTKDYLGDSSFVFEDYTPESLKNTIIRALNAIEENPDVLAIKAREAAEKNFDTHVIVNRLQDILTETVNTKKNGLREVGSSELVESR